MPVTMAQVLDLLNRTEPAYAQATQLGPEALPHLMRLVEEGDSRLAPRATHLASFINADQSPAVVERAARSPDPRVRAAAAGALSRLTTISTPLASRLLEDGDAGVRYWTLRALQVHEPAGLKERVEQLVSSDPDDTVQKLAQQLVVRLR